MLSIDEIRAIGTDIEQRALETVHGLFNGDNEDGEARDQNGVRFKTHVATKLYLTRAAAAAASKVTINIKTLELPAKRGDVIDVVNAIVVNGRDQDD